jgi:hypothetical protein
MDSSVIMGGVGMTLAGSVTINGDMNIKPGTRMTAQNSAIVTVNGNFTIGTNVTVTLLLSAASLSGLRSTVVIAQYARVTGTFDAISLSPSTSPTSGCSLVATPSYGTTTLSVVVSVDPCSGGGLSPGTIAGIVVGAVVGGVLVALLIILLVRHQRKQQAQKLAESMHQNYAL